VEDSRHSNDMIQVVITYIDQFRDYSYVCTVDGAFELWFYMRDNPSVSRIVVKSMNGTKMQLDEGGQPLHGIHSFLDLAAHVNTK
jgi:hypothetical protein